MGGLLILERGRWSPPRVAEGRECGRSRGPGNLISASRWAGAVGREEDQVPLTFGCNHIDVAAEIRVGRGGGNLEVDPLPPAGTEHMTWRRRKLVMVGDSTGWWRRPARR